VRGNPRQPDVTPVAELLVTGMLIIAPVGALARRVKVPLALRTLRHELGVEPNGRSWLVATGATCSWLSPGFEFVEGLGGLIEGKRDGSVPVHGGAAVPEFSRSLLAQNFRHDQADRSEIR
jgi:hypothetical protein